MPCRRREACLALLTAAVLLLGLGAGLFGSGFRYGMLADDYSHKLWAFDPERGAWTPRLALEQTYLRPIGQLLVINLANLLPDHEVPLRLLWAVVHLCNVLLTGLLVFRLLRSHLAALLAGAALLLPVQAHQAIFWHSGAASALLGALSVLVAMHLLLGAVRAGRTWLRYALLGLLAVVLIPLFYEQASVGILVLPLLAVFDRPISKGRVMRATALLLIAAGLLLLYWWLVLRHCPNIAERGGMEPSLASVVREGLPKTRWGVRWTLWAAYGTEGFSAIGRMGALALWASPWAVAAAALFAITSTVAVGLRAAGEQGSWKSWQLLLLVAVGCAWTAAAFLPVAVVKGQTVEPRLLYVPWIGLSFAFSGMATLILRTLRGRWKWLPAAGLASVFVAGAVLMAGFERVYQLRYTYDRAQLAALVAAVPALPRGPVVIVPVETDEQFVSGVEPRGQRLDSLLPGLFETGWGTRAAVSMAYRKRGVSAATRSRWSPLVLKSVSYQEGDAILQLADGRVRASQCLAFSYRNGKVILHDSVAVMLPDLARMEIDLPLARRWAAPGVAFEQMTLAVSRE